MDNNQKNFTEFKVRVTFFLNFLPLNQRKIAENIGIEESYLTAIKKGKIKTGGYKLWKGVQKKYPKWVPFLQGETTYPPGSMPLPEVDKEETKKLYKKCLSLLTKPSILHATSPLYPKNISTAGQLLPGHHPPVSALYLER